MRSTTSTIHCDAEDGDCGNWDVDFYAGTVTSVGGVRITQQERAPGWLSTDLTDYCPEHKGDQS